MWDSISFFKDISNSPGWRCPSHRCITRWFRRIRYITRRSLVSRGGCSYPFQHRVFKTYQFNIPAVGLLYNYNYFSTFSLSAPVFSPKVKNKEGDGTYDPHEDEN